MAGRVDELESRVTTLESNQFSTTTKLKGQAYYNYPINDFISITPILQVITDASNQSANDSIYTGTMRSVFNF